MPDDELLTQDEAADLLTSAEAADLLRMTAASLAQLRHRGGGPKYHRLTARTILYKRSECLAWLERVTYERTDKPVAVAS